MNLLGQIDLALLPCGGTYTMDVPEAIEATLSIKPRVVIPMHSRGADLTVFKKKVEKASKTKVVLLDSGQKFTPNGP